VHDFFILEEQKYTSQFKLAKNEEILKRIKCKTTKTTVAPITTTISVTTTVPVTTTPIEKI